MVGIIRNRGVVEQAGESGTSLLSVLSEGSMSDSQSAIPESQYDFSDQ